MRRIRTAVAILALVLCTTTSSLAEDSLEEQLAAIRAEIEAILARLEALRASIDMILLPAETLTPSLGLSRSTAEPFYSRIPADDAVICTAIGCAPDAPLAELLTDATNLFAPLTSTLKRTKSGDQTGTTLTDNLYVKTISGDGADGFDVSYVIGGEERSVHFGSDGFDTEDCPGCYYAEDEEGRGHWFWQFYEELAYADVYGGSYPGGNRPYSIFGARTEIGNLPVGAASYFGRMYAQAYKKDDPDHDQRVVIDGRMVLTADFDESTLDGAIRALRSKPRGGQYSALSDTTAHFAISEGRIVEGQFTATLTGMNNVLDFPDDDSTVLFDADSTVFGYEGGILGEFYGPAAEEVGGVLSASSDAHNRVLAGFFGARQLNSTAGGKLPTISMATLVDRPRSTVRHTGSAGVTGIQRDGVEQTIHLEATDLGTYTPSPWSYHEMSENRSHFLWDATNSFYHDPEFDHFNVNGWAITDWEDESYDFDRSTSRSGFVVYGTPTEADDLPTGTAEYSGRAWVQILPADNPASNARSYLRGDLALNANFGADTVGGSISWNEIRDPGQSSYRTTSRQWTVGNGAITGVQITADLTETGDTGTDVDMVGQFYGPAAAEAGGVLKGTLSDGDDVVRGWFGGTKQ